MLCVMSGACIDRQSASDPRSDPDGAARDARARHHRGGRRQRAMVDWRVTGVGRLLEPVRFGGSPRRVNGLPWGRATDAMCGRPRVRGATVVLRAQRPPVATTPRNAGDGATLFWVDLGNSPVPLWRSVTGATVTRCRRCVGRCLRWVTPLMLSRSRSNAPTRAFVTLCDPITTVTRLRSVTDFGLGCRKLATIRSSAQLRTFLSVNHQTEIENPT